MTGGAITRDLGNDMVCRLVCQLSATEPAPGENTRRTDLCKSIYHNT